MCTGGSVCHSRSGNIRLHVLPLRSCSRPSPWSLHPTALGKWLSQGLSTLQSGKITTPISPYLHSYYFGWSTLKGGKPPNTSTGRSRAGKGNHPERGGAWTRSSLLWNSAHCLLTDRPVFGHFWSPESHLTILLILILR